MTRRDKTPAPTEVEAGAQCGMLDAETKALWVFAGLALAYTVLVIIPDPSPTVASRVLWQSAEAVLDSKSPYDETTRTLSFVDPPSAVPILLPLGLVSFEVARLVKMVVDVASIVGALLLTMKTVGVNGRTSRAAVVALVAAHLEPVRFVLEEGNFDPQCLLALAVFSFMLSSGRLLLAGAALGLSLSIKPILGGLLLVLLAMRAWRALGLAGAIPATLMAIGVRVTPNSGRFFGDVVPFLARGQSADLQDYNVSIQGAVAQYDLPGVLGVVLRIAAVGVLVVAVRGRLRRHGWQTDGRTVIEVAGLLVLGTLLTFSYSFPHYTIYVIPVLVVQFVTRTQGNASVLGLAAFLAVSIYTPLPLTGGAEITGRLLPLLGLLALLWFLAAVPAHRAELGSDFVEDRHGSPLGPRVRPCNTGGAVPVNVDLG